MTLALAMVRRWRLDLCSRVDQIIGGVIQLDESIDRVSGFK